MVREEVEGGDWGRRLWERRMLVSKDWNRWKGRGAIFWD